MSREIKFRVMDMHGNWNYFTLGDFVCQTPVPAQVNPETWTQFTGLKDVNGVEIYEGDIVEYFCEFTEETSNHEVKYFDKDCYPAFDLKPSICDEMNGFSAIEYQGIGEIMVIGNIYQNPELLK